jgi:hypothetical protein
MLDHTFCSIDQLLLTQAQLGHCSREALLQSFDRHCKAFGATVDDWRLGLLDSAGGSSGAGSGAYQPLIRVSNDRHGVDFGLQLRCELLHMIANTICMTGQNLRWLTTATVNRAQRLYNTSGVAGWHCKSRSVDRIDAENGQHRSETMRGQLLHGASHALEFGQGRWVCDLEAVGIWCTFADALLGPGRRLLGFVHAVHLAHIFCVLVAHISVWPVQLQCGMSHELVAWLDCVAKVQHSHTETGGQCDASGV